MMFPWVGHGTEAPASECGASHNSEEFTANHSRTKMPLSVAKPVIADRIKWEHSPAFNPIPFFDDAIVREAFVNPSKVRLPPEAWPHQLKGKVFCSKKELLALASKWDSKGACKIFRVSEVNWDECVGIFAAPKDDSFDHLILNPSTANSRMQSFAHYTKQLAWNSHDAPLMIFLWFSLMFPWYSHGLPMVFPWYSYEFPLIFPWYPHGIPMTFPRFPHGISVIPPWNSHDVPMSVPWYSDEVSMVFPWHSYDLPMIFSWYSHEFPNDISIFPESACEGFFVKKQPL